MTTISLNNAVELNWDPVAGASSYRVYRNEHGCDRAQVPLAEVTGTSYLDEDLVNGIQEYYRVEPIGANPACTGALSVCMEAMAEPLAGSVKYNRQSYACQDMEILMRIQDSNDGGSSLSVTVWSDTESAPETVILPAIEPGSDTYAGSIFTTQVAAAADGLISVSDGDVITAEYIDADNGQGGINVPVQTSVVADCYGPIISSVGEINVTDTSATIVWNTSEPSDTNLLWGETPPPGTAAGGAGGVVAHQVNLGGLEACTVYYYEVESTDLSGNTLRDDNGGRYFHFETFGDFGQGLQPCNAGRLFLDAGIYTCGDTLAFEVVDLGLNSDPGVAETIAVTFTSTSETSPETVLATEIGADSSTFAGTIALAVGVPAADGVLQVQSGDLVTGTYVDPDDGTGAAVMTFDSAIMDCGEPEIQNLRLANLTDQRFTISFETSEPGDTVVEWGTTTALGNVESDPSLTTYHSVEVNTAELCQQLYFRVSSTDVYGNTAVADNGGSPFPFSTLDIPGLYYRETFENGANGWSLGGEFEIGAPQGLGGSPGNDDPTEAYNNTGVLGTDLTGQGDFPGDYEHGLTVTAKSPNQDASAWTNTELRIRRYLNVRENDDALIAIAGKGQSGGPVWNSLGSTISDSAYSLQVFDVSALVDGQRTVAVEFGIEADEINPFTDDGVASGWNVDDVILKDASLPPFGACGGCATAPSFGGALSAVDSDACGADGIIVSWADAVGWGSGGAGTYAVYRDTTPGFTPSAGNLVASGVATLSYLDNTAPDGPTLYYLVRAESDETCGPGPNNGGGVDSNAVYIAASNSSSAGIPGAITPVQVDLVNLAHVRLNWPAVADATLYRIYRSSTPDPSDFYLLAETDQLSHEDLGEGGTFNNYYYQVRGVNACDQEGN